MHTWYLPKAHIRCCKITSKLGANTSAATCTKGNKHQNNNQQMLVEIGTTVSRGPLQELQRRSMQPLALACLDPIFFSEAPWELVQTVHVLSDGEGPKIRNKIEWQITKDGKSYKLLPTYPIKGLAHWTKFRIMQKKNANEKILA